MGEGENGWKVGPLRRLLPFRVGPGFHGRLTGRNCRDLGVSVKATFEIDESSASSKSPKGILTSSVMKRPPRIDLIVAEPFWGTPSTVSSQVPTKAIRFLCSGPGVVGSAPSVAGILSISTGRERGKGRTEENEIWHDYLTGFVLHFPHFRK
jgi:hypothetical protein